MQKEIKIYENAILVGLYLYQSNKHEIDDQLKELELLALTAGAYTKSIITQSLIKPNPSTFIGTGKLNSLKNISIELNSNLIIFNDDISPSQIKNIQKNIGNNIKVIDRTGLILDIFRKNAKTKEAKTQVQLAHFQYLLPRLTRQWTHLERQMGGIGTRAGAGETQIEVDRRLIRNKISRLKVDLLKIQKQRNTQRYNRFNTFRIALIGYTNAGKSTLMNTLTNANVLVQDKLFATLDTTTRKLKIDTNFSILLSDTVGFIRNLPHSLIASFRSTLNEINDVNLLIKVFDASSNNINDHINTVEETLTQMNVANKRFITIFNKIDIIKDKNILIGLKKRFNNAIFISSTKLMNINELIDKIKKIISSSYINYKFKISHSQSNIIDYIYQNTYVINKKSDYNGIIIEIKGSKESIAKINSLINFKQ